MKSGRPTTIRGFGRGREVWWNADEMTLRPACPELPGAPAPELSRRFSRGVLRLGPWRSTALLTLVVWALAMIALVVTLPQRTGISIAVDYFLRRRRAEAEG